MSGYFQWFAKLMFPFSEPETLFCCIAQIFLTYQTVMKSREKRVHSHWTHRVGLIANMRGERSYTMNDECTQDEYICGQRHIFMNFLWYKCHATVLFLSRYSSAIAILSFLTVKCIWVNLYWQLSDLTSLWIPSSFNIFSCCFPHLSYLCSVSEG